MNQKQKLGYTLFGAGIMALGIIIGQLSTPNIEAQNNGVFDEIQCSKLTVVDRSAKPAISLYALEQGNGILVSNRAGEPAFFLIAGEDENRLTVANKIGNPAVRLTASEEGSHISVIDNAGKEAVRLHGGETENGVFVRDKAGETAMALGVNKLFGNKITVHETALNDRWEAP